MTFPKHTPEYVAAKAALQAAYDQARSVPWLMFRMRQLTHAEYCERVDHAYCDYANALEPHWVKAGGSKNQKARTMNELNAEYSAKWAKEVTA